MTTIEPLHFDSAISEELPSMAELHSIFDSGNYDKQAAREAIREIMDFRPFTAYNRSCPFCNSQVERVYAKVATLKEFYEDWGWYGYECTGCGWGWNYEVSDNWGACSPTVHVGRLYKAEEPAGELYDAVRAINANLEVLYKMNPTKFEQFVGGILKEFYDCQVLHVGKSSDGGIDLILIDSNDGKTPVQVKRRSTKSKTESVAIVREFRGAMLLHGYNNGLIVTTADHFSKEAVEASQPQLHHSIRQKIELVDVRQLFDIMGLIGRRRITERLLKIRFNVVPDEETLKAILGRINIDLDAQ